MIPLHLAQAAVPGFEAHHDASPLCVLAPASLAVGDQVTVRLRTRGEVDAVSVRYSRDGDPRFAVARAGEPDAGGWRWWSVDVPVMNPRVGYRFLVAADGLGWSINVLGCHDVEVPDADDFRLAAGPQPPEWVHEGTTYEIFPDRFARGSRPVGADLPEWAEPAAWDEPVAHGTPRAMRQWYGGTLWGVAERLDDLADLGVTTIYLTPFFPAQSNHRYDATTFDRVDPLLGGDEALAHLTSEAARRGMHVIGDLTLHHTGSAHEWFRAALADPAAPESSFYFFADDRSGYAGFFDLPGMPKLNHGDPDLRRRLYAGPDSVVAHYVRDLGLSGWRIDVAQSAGVHGAVDDTGLVAALTRRTLDDLAAEAGVPAHYLVAELQHDFRDKLAGGGWQATMNYAGFTRPVWSWLTDGRADHHWGAPADFGRYGGGQMVRAVEAFTGAVPWAARQASLNVLDSHDTPRLRSVAGRSAQHLGAVLQFTLPGTPMVYAGDEVGLEGLNMEDSRRPYPPEGQRDAATLAHYRALADVRGRLAALREGGIRWLHAGDDLVVFVRERPDAAALVALDRRGTLDGGRVLALLAADGLWSAAEPEWAAAGAAIWACRPAD
ncbi:MAG TPA: glycoside hydrolase family 13 protein [Propionibacteriaceae bacterium]|nr:glycoside hydrolase family 13 protein [Propionibacteriaceae bacterium]